MTKRLIAAATLAAACLIAVPAGGAKATSNATLPTHKVAMILCGPGLVYRCGPQGCFCVPPQ